MIDSGLDDEKYRLFGIGRGVVGLRYFSRAVSRLAATVIMLSLPLSTLFGCHAGMAKEASTPTAARIYDLEGLRLIVHIANRLYPVRDFNPREGRAEADSLSRRMSRLVYVGGKVRIANRAWFAKASAPRGPALVFTKKTFDLETSVANLGTVETQRDIREWLGAEAPIFPISSMTDYIIASRSVFSDPWAVGFDASETVQRPFFGSRGITRPAFLTKGEIYLHYERSFDGAHVRIPLRGDIGLWLYEPKNANLLARPPTAWVDSTYRPIFSKILGQECFLSFPRFSASDPGERNLIPMLRSLQEGHALGMPPLRVSRAPSMLVQSSIIDVNEHGVSTSSTTILYRRLRVIVTTAKVIIDHPFAFAIVDDIDKRVLFTGAITDL
jgi:hypothetical protein